MRVYRICRAAYRALDGEGARLYGGRWNRPGRSIIYTSTTLALAALEYLLHIDPEDVPLDLLALTIDLPDDLEIDRITPTILPVGWERVPELLPACQDIGDAWADAGRVPALRVPAAPIPEEMNLLLNARHPAVRRAQIVGERPFFYDPRLLA